MSIPLTIVDVLHELPTDIARIAIGIFRNLPEEERARANIRFQETGKTLPDAVFHFSTWSKTPQGKAAWSAAHKRDYDNFYLLREDKANKLS